MYQVLLRLSQMRPISHTYACWGVSFTYAQPASIASTPRIAGPSARVTRVAVSERAVGTMAASFGDRQAVGRDPSRHSRRLGALRALDLTRPAVGISGHAKEVPMKPNKLMLAGLIVTLVGIFIVIKHEMGLPSYWTPLLVGIGLLVAGAIWSMISGKSKIS